MELTRITVTIDQISIFRNSTNHYILNGNWKIDFAGSYDFAGTSFVYERLSPLGEKAKKKKNKVISGERREKHYRDEQNSLQNIVKQDPGRARENG